MRKTTFKNKILYFSSFCFDYFLVLYLHYCIFLLHQFNHTYKEKTVVKSVFHINEPFFFLESINTHYFPKQASHPPEEFSCTAPRARGRLWLDEPLPMRWELTWRSSMGQKSWASTNPNSFWQNTRRFDPALWGRGAMPRTPSDVCVCLQVLWWNRREAEADFHRGVSEVNELVPLAPPTNAHLSVCFFTTEIKANV